MNTHVTFINRQGRVLSTWYGPISAVWQNMPSGALYVEGTPPALDGWMFDIAQAQWVPVLEQEGA